MTVTVRPFLMFEGKAEEAVRFYVGLIPDSRIVAIERYGAEGPGAEGSVFKGTVSLGGQEVMFTDSYVKHGFGFTPSFSLFVDCASEDDVRRIAAALADGGATMMPANNYGFSRLFAWVADRFGVSWQLNYA